MRWRQMSRECSGRAQSPIDIKHKNVIISQHLRLHFYNYDQLIKFKLSNAHHTVKMNPTGAAYDQESEPHAGGQRSGLNSSSILDIMTADEYVDFTPTSNQKTSSGDRAASGGGPPPRGDQMSRLISGAVSRQDTNQPQQTASATRPEESSKAARDGNQQQRADEIEHEREQSHSFGSLFGFHSAKDRAAYDGAPTIKLDWLDEGNNEYKLRDIHFHWGERRDNGSEHAIDGRRAAMEVSSTRDG
jgi:hypothetical protein